MPDTCPYIITHRDSDIASYRSANSDSKYPSHRSAYRISDRSTYGITLGSTNSRTHVGALSCTFSNTHSGTDRFAICYADSIAYSSTNCVTHGCTHSSPHAGTDTGLVSRRHRQRRKLCVGRLQHRCRRRGLPWHVQHVLPLPWCPRRRVLPQTVTGDMYSV